ncbi:hypothetical protein J5N97_014856 [Dioscorea zingiberensis]|uniref:Leucine-rich repeat-containing N-terminal plant-type domain-containing protein n=1 Tax=Dioscorea zingiberensis TaxID=325984 RepID=A0A9D5HKG6_9LILI|nr:hypothetical protein J5N97_014856 [Dioscorea zingiberensis]
MSSSDALTSHSQCLDLLELKKGFFYYKRYSTLPVWLAGTDCCQWKGVTCDEESGLIVSLDLSNRLMGGNISASLFNLTSLERLNLAFNSFNQRAVRLSGFHKLANLTHLNLSGSGFSGQVPVGISRLKKLISLDLSHNYGVSSSLKLEKPDLGMLIKDLSNLKELYLDGVNVSSMGSEWCGAISESLLGLEALSMKGCSLLGPIDSSLSELRNLSLLVLENNPLLVSNVPDSFANFSSLRELRLGYCQLQGLFPMHVFELTNLKVLDLSNNPMLSGYFPEFSTNSSLEALIVQHTNFSGSLPDSLGNLKSLTFLDLYASNVLGPIPRSIWILNKLVYLDLSFNHFTGEIPPMFDGSPLSHLEYVNLGSNALTGSIPTYLFTISALEHLYLDNNKFSGQLKEFVNASSTLRYVILKRNNLRGKIPKSILDLPSLESLSLSSNKFDGTMKLELFGHLRNLSYLDLSGIDLSISDQRQPFSRNNAAKY